MLLDRFFYSLSFLEFIAIFFLLIGGFGALRSLLIVMTNNYVQGKVINVDVVYARQTPCYYPVIEYHDGYRLRRERVGVGQRAASYHVGDEVSVIYNNSDDPAMLFRFTDLWLRPLVYVCIGAIMFLPPFIS